MKLKTFSVVLLMLVFLLMTGCQAVGHLRNAGAVYKGWRSYGAVKELTGASAVMHGVEAVRIETEIAPRDESRADEVSRAFAENAVFLVEEALGATGIDVPLCFDDCPEMTLLIQFQETGFDRSFAERVTLGSQLRGDIYFVDAGRNEVLDTVDLHSTHDYVGVAGSLQDAIVMQALVSRRQQLQQRVQRGEITNEKAGRIMESHINAANAIQPVRSDLRVFLTAS